MMRGVLAIVALVVATPASAEPCAETQVYVARILGLPGGGPPR